MDPAASATTACTPYGVLAAQLGDAAARGDAAAGSFAPTTGNSLQVLNGAQAYTQRLVADLSAATKQIDVSMYALQTGPAGGMADQVVQVLCAKARAGVPVTVALDAIGSQLSPWHALDPKSHGLVQQLRDAGVQVLIKPITLGHGATGDDARASVDHRKLIEIDGHISYQGGINLVDAWSGWQDLMLRAEGPAAAQSGALIAARWRDLGGTVTERRVQILEAGLRAPASDSTAAVLQLSNGNAHRRELTEYELHMIRTARSSIRVANPYWSDEEAMEALVDAAKRGVRVEVLLPPKAGEAADIIAQPFRQLWASRIQAAGGTVLQLPKFSHAKAIIADGEALVGSLNLDNGATRRNYESAIATRDPGVYSQLSAVFDAQAATAAPLAPPSALIRLFGKVRDALHLTY